MTAGRKGQKHKISLSESVISEIPQRLYASAEAFYFSGVLCSLKFDAEKITRGCYVLLRGLSLKEMDVSHFASQALSL